MKALACCLLAAALALPAWGDSVKGARWKIEHLRDSAGEGRDPRNEADDLRLATRGIADGPASRRGKDGHAA